MDKRERHGREEDTYTQASRLFKPPTRRYKKRSHSREQSRSGSEAGSADRTRRAEEWTSSSWRSSRPKKAASPGRGDLHRKRKTSDEGAEGERSAKENLAKSDKADEPVRVDQQKRGLDSPNSTHSERDVSASASAVPRRARLVRDKDKRASVSGSPAMSSGGVKKGGKKARGSKTRPPAAPSTTRPSGEAPSSRKKDSQPVQSPKHSADASPAASKGESNKEAADDEPEPRVIGGWLDILRGAASSPAKVPTDEEDDKVGSPSGSKLSDHRAVSSRSPAKSDLKIERKPNMSREANVHPQSTSQSGSYVEQHETPLSVHTRDLESETPVEEDYEGADVEQAAGWWWWCTWFNVWLGVGVFSVVVLLPLVLVLLGQDGHVFAHGGHQNVSESSDLWAIVTEREKNPTIPLVLWTNKSFQWERKRASQWHFTEVVDPASAALTLLVVLTIALTASGLETYAQEKAYTEEDVNCRYPIYDNVPVSGVPNSYGTTTSTSHKPQYRVVICVVDAKYIFRHEHSKGFEYSLKDIPARYCTAMVYYAMYLRSAFHTQEHKIAYGKQALEDLQIAARSVFRNNTIPVYVTIGGSRKDSKALYDLIMLPDRMDNIASSFPSNIQKLYILTRKQVVLDLGNVGRKANSTSLQMRTFDLPYLDCIANKGDGINLDWNRPGDMCGSSTKSNIGRRLLEFANNVTKFRLMLTVPPLPAYLDYYNLKTLLPLDHLQYVVVATHKLRRPNVVACAGERVLAMTALRQIRDQFLEEGVPEDLLRKFTYSISVGADIFMLSDYTKVGYLAPISAIANFFNGRQIMLGKTSFTDVCYLISEDEDADQECRVVKGSRTFNEKHGVIQEVAALAGPEELKRRMLRSYEDGFGDTAVAVFDVILDDYPNPQCSLQVQAPQVQTIAETGPS